MSILQISMSHVSDPPKIDYTDARTEDAYYKAHQGYELTLFSKLKPIRQIVLHLLQAHQAKTPGQILKSSQSPL